MNGEFDDHILDLFCTECDEDFEVKFGAVKGSKQAICPFCGHANGVDIWDFHAQMKRTKRLIEGK